MFPCIEHIDRFNWRKIVHIKRFKSIYDRICFGEQKKLFGGNGCFFDRILPVCGFQFVQDLIGTVNDRFGQTGNLSNMDPVLRRLIRKLRHCNS